MISRNELMHRPEYYVDRVQNEIFRIVRGYMDKEGLNQSQLAARLGVSKGYMSQILNGNFNFSVTKLVELCLSLGIAPNLQLADLENFIICEENRLKRLQSHGKVEVEVALDNYCMADCILDDKV